MAGMDRDGGGGCEDAETAVQTTCPSRSLHPALSHPDNTFLPASGMYRAVCTTPGQGAYAPYAIRTLNQGSYVRYTNHLKTAKRVRQITTPIFKTCISWARPDRWRQRNAESRGRGGLWSMTRPLSSTSPERKVAMGTQQEISGNLSLIGPPCIDDTCTGQYK
jgi:hypothetical protein